MENVLDDFKADGVIKNWEYKESFDESVVGKKGWYKSWINYSIIIYPTDNLLEGYKKSVGPFRTSNTGSNNFRKNAPIMHQIIPLLKNRRDFLLIV